RLSILFKRDKSVPVAVAELQLTAGPVDRLLGGLQEVPLGKLRRAHEPIGGSDVDAGEEDDDAVGDVEAILVVDVVLGVEEVVPLRLGLLVVREAEMVPFPLPGLASVLDVCDDGIEGDLMVGGGGGGVVAEFEAAVVVLAVAVGGPRGYGGEKQEGEESDGGVD
ncbi:hypothetical protein MUK42_35075, partial [Musa troglodytarum]